MGTAGSYTPEKLVMCVLSSSADSVGRADVLRALLVEQWGDIDFASDPIPFTATDYYEQEMGTGISRSFLSFRRLVDPSSLAAVKLLTNTLEERFRVGGARRVNLDPGLMALSRFSLATTKESAHRVPLTGGIYAEITLLYSKTGFRTLEWTYPDFRTPEYLAILGEIRALYKAQLR
jgi:Domain of unknown function (DUF4416)